MGIERYLGRLGQYLNGGRGRSSRGDGAETNCPDHQPAQTTRTEGDDTPMGTLADTREALQNQELAARAAFWANKYREDRSKTVEQHQRKIAEQLQGQFHVGRKVARQLAHYATREWA